MTSENQRTRRARCALALAALLLAGPVSAADDAGAHLKRAETLLQHGKLKAAVIELKNALQQDPSLVQARIRLGQAYLRTGDGAAAQKELERARALGDQSPGVQLDLAEADLMQGDLDGALKLVDPGPKGSDAVRARALTLRGMAQLGKKQRDTARASLEAALKLVSDLPKASLTLARLDLMEGHAKKAEQGVDAVLKRHPDDIPALLLKADLLRKAGKPKAALEQFDRAAKVNGQDPRVLLGRATVNLGLRHLDAAKRDLDAVDKVQKGLIMTAYLRGLLAYLQHDLDTAHSELQRVLGVAPNHAPSQLLFGLVSYDRKEYEMVEEYLGRFLASHQGNVAASKVLAAARLKLKNPRGAIELLEPMAASETKDAQFLTLLGSAYLMDKQYAKGTALLQQAVQLTPKAAPLRTQLALGLLASGKADDAAGQLQTAVDLDKGSIQADVLLVLTHLRAHELDKALSAAQAMEKRMPKNPVAYNMTGLAYLARKENDKARERFSKALEVDPKFVTAEANLARMDVAAGDLGAAEKRFRHILKVDPGNLTGLTGLAGIAERKGDTGTMIKRLQEAADKNAKRPEPLILLARYYLKNKDAPKALDAAKEAENRAPDLPAAIAILGRAQAASKSYSSAERNFARLVKVAPTLQNRLLLAETRIATKDYGGARDVLNDALKENPKSLPVKAILVTVALADNRDDDALLAALNIEKEHPKSPVGYRLEGLVRARLGEWSNAVAAYEHAYAIKKDADLARRLADAYQKAGNNDKAVATLKDWLSAKPDDLPTRLLLAMSLQNWGRDREALAQYEILRAEDQKNVVVANNLAWLYFTANDPRAVKVAEAAYALNSQRPQVADTYGWILLNRGGDAQKALTVLQQAYVALPTSAEIGYHVAVALHRVGRDTEAARTLRDILSGSAKFEDKDKAEALLEAVQKK